MFMIASLKHMIHQGKGEHNQTGRYRQITPNLRIVKGPNRLASVVDWMTTVRGPNGLASVVDWMTTVKGLPAKHVNIWFCQFL